jgi:hypothetical protein
MKISVECYAGYRGDQEPRAFQLGDSRFDVIELLDRWLDPAHRYFKVKVTDGRVFILRHDAASSDWELAGLVGTASHEGAAGNKTVH